MSRSGDPDHFFQTDQSLHEAARKAKKAKNEHGQPIRLKSKISALAADPSDNAVFIAESVGQIRRLLPDVSDTIPLAALSFSPFPISVPVLISPDGRIDQHLPRSYDTIDLCHRLCQWR